MNKSTKEKAARSQRNQITNLVLAALFAALTTVMTAYIFHIPDARGGYYHIGDGMIYLAGAILPLPYAVAAAAIGAGIADLLTAPMWFLPTLLIKSVMVLPFTSKGERIVTVRNLFAVVLGGVVNVVGYCLAEVAMAMLGVMPGGEAGLAAAFTAAFALSFPSAILQPLGSGILFVALGLTLDGIGFKKRMLRGSWG